LNYVRDVPIIGCIEKQIAGKILDVFLALGKPVKFSDIWYNILQYGQRNSGLAHA
jgi:hypothetical protein